MRQRRQKALQGGSAAMLATLASKAQEPGILSQVMNLINSFGARSAMGAAAGAGSSSSSSVPSASPLSSVSASSPVATSFLTTVFGNNMGGIQGKIADFAGLRASSAGSILTMAAPLVLGTLASKVNREGLTASGLGSALAAELPNLRSFLPAGFAIPGASNVTAQASRVVDGVRPRNMNWLWLLALAVIVVLGLIWFFGRGRVNNAVNTVTNGAASLGAMVKASLPGGVDLNIPQNGMESRLLAFIQNPNAQPTDTTWFEFDRLQFDTGAATLQPSAAEQLQNIANILKAYPNVTVRIGGYTDNTGDANTNLQLSQDRASNVMAQLVTLGVDPARMDAKGYGDQIPVADNSTDAGRAQNRRIALRVNQK